MTGQNSDAAEMLRAMRAFLKENDMMAYLSMMAVRLLELRRVLEGALGASTFTATHSEPLSENTDGRNLWRRKFQTEIIWKRTTRAQ